MKYIHMHSIKLCIFIYIYIGSQKIKKSITINTKIILHLNPDARKKCLMYRHT